MSPELAIFSLTALLSAIGYPMAVLADRHPRLRKRAYLLNVLGIVLSGSTLALGSEHSLWLAGCIWSLAFQNVLLKNAGEVKR